MYLSILRLNKVKNVELNGSQQFNLQVIDKSISMALKIAFTRSGTERESLKIVIKA